MSSSTLTKSQPAVLEVKGLTKHYKTGKSGIFRRQSLLKAVDDVSFQIFQGEILGLIGESGCGKTTIGRMLIKLTEPTAGTARLDGREILSIKKKKFRPVRKKIQMVFQDPFASLNPRQTIGQTIAEPVRTFKMAGSKAEVQDKVVEALSQVGIADNMVSRYPFEFSGGQRQRISIARAIVVRPKIVIADEPVSALDVSIQAQILNLLQDLQASNQMSMLFISHDLGVVRYMADRIAVMYRGKIVETGSKASIFSNPLHPYTHQLLRCVPGFQRKASPRTRFEVSINARNQSEAGCKYLRLCQKSTEICGVESPSLMPIEKGHYAACYNL